MIGNDFTNNLLKPQDRTYTIRSLAQAAGCPNPPKMDHEIRGHHQKKIWDKTTVEFNCKEDAQQFLNHWGYQCAYTWHLLSSATNQEIEGAWQQGNNRARITIDPYRTKSEQGDSSVLTCCCNILRKRTDDENCYTQEGKGGQRCILRQHNKDMQIVKVVTSAQGGKRFEKQVQVIIRLDLKPPQAQVYAKG